MDQGNRKRMYPLRLTEPERARITQKMKEAGIPTMSAYMRKMALNGYILKLEIPEIKEMISLLRYSSNNLNQITRRANETGRVYAEDLAEIRRNQDKLWDGMNAILQKLGQME